MKYALRRSSAAAGAGIVEDWAVKIRNARDATWAVLYRNDDFGKAGLQGFDAAASFYHLNVVTRQAYGTTDQEFDPQGCSGPYCACRQRGLT